MIYLLSSDGYPESIIFRHYATNEKEIEKILIDYIGDMFYEKVRNIRVDLCNKLVKFESRYMYADKTEEWERNTYHLIVIEGLKE